MMTLCNARYEKNVCQTLICTFFTQPCFKAESTSPLLIIAVIGCGGDEEVKKEKNKKQF